MKIASFPFSFKGEVHLGKIYRPYIQIYITSDKVDEWVYVEMLVDTGADYSLFPKRYAQLLQINLDKDCKPEKTHGIGGLEKIYLCKSSVTIKIGSFEKVIPVGFLSRDDVPALLGRLQALEILEMTMKNKVTTFSM